LHDALPYVVFTLLGPPAVAVDTIDAIKKFVEDNKVGIVGFFKDAESPAAKNFKSVAGDMDDQVFPPATFSVDSSVISMLRRAELTILFLIRNSPSPQRLQFSQNMP
jgi:hypothetical protein